jgi:hypothetical protein
VAFLFCCPKKQQPLAERKSFSTCHLRSSQCQISRKGTSSLPYNLSQGLSLCKPQLFAECLD